MKPLITQAHREAIDLIDRVIAELNHRAKFHRVLFGDFWQYGETPDDRLAAMGDQGEAFVSVAGENLAHMARVAALTGAKLDDFLSPIHYAPPRKFLTHADDETIPPGHARLGPPAEGHDAWGRPIPEPEPEEEEAL